MVNSALRDRMKKADQEQEQTEEYEKLIPSLSYL